MRLPKRTRNTSLGRKERLKLLALIAARDGGYRCYYCGLETFTEAMYYTDEKGKLNIYSYPSQATIDHLIPLSVRGYNLNTLPNLVIACHACNHERGNQPYLTFKRQKQLERKSKELTCRVP